MRVMDDLNEIRAKWWHRLAVVILLLPVVPAVIIAGSLVYEGSFNNRYVYGWNEPLGDAGVRCSVTYDPGLPEYDYFSCGEFRSATEALDQMLKTGAVRHTGGERTARADLAVMQRREVELNLYYDMRREFSRSDFGTALGIAVAAFAVYALLAWAVIAALIWVTYGRFRVDRW